MRGLLPLCEVPNPPEELPALQTIGRRSKSSKRPGTLPRCPHAAPVHRRSTRFVRRCGPFRRCAIFRLTRFQLSSLCTLIAIQQRVLLVTAPTSTDRTRLLLARVAPHASSAIPLQRCLNSRPRNRLLLTFATAQLQWLPHLLRAKQRQMLL